MDGGKHHDQCHFLLTMGKTMNVGLGIRALGLFPDL